MNSYTISYFNNVFDSSLALYKLSFELSPEQREQLFAITIHLLEENEKYNLTAIRDFEGVVRKHIIDSLTLLPYIPDSASVIDIGSGAGFPALPIAVARPDIRVIALDSTEKKTNFIKNTAELAGITNISALFGRAEEIAVPDNVLREHFDVAVARSLASLPVLAELCMPFVRVDGAFLAMKSEKALHELEEARLALKAVGADDNVSVERLYDAGEGDVRVLFRIEKVQETPDNLPRHYGQIKKRPL